MSLNPTAQELAAVDALYARLPTLMCRFGCAEACGPIVVTDLEARRLQMTAHRKPRTIPLRLEGRDREQCVYLNDRQRCTVYAVRPLICRAWGLVKCLSCPRGCVPSRWLDDVEFVEIAQAVERIGGGRVLRTTPDGLMYVPGESFARLTPQRSHQAIAADAELTRSLRAIHGGRIIAAIDHTKD